MLTTDADFQGLNVIGLFWLDTCSFIDEYGWTYASLTFGSGESPESITGPFGNQLQFMDEETFAIDHESWMNEYYWLVYDVETYAYGYCTDDNSTYDALRDNCDWYTSYPEDCGGFDDDDFTAS